MYLIAQLLPQLLSGPEADYRLLSGRRKNPRVAFTRFPRLRKFFRGFARFPKLRKNLHFPPMPFFFYKVFTRIYEKITKQKIRNKRSQFLQSLKASLLAQKSALTVKVNLIILRKGTNGTLTRGFPAYVHNIQDVN